jgi:hypothetical protein
MTRNVNTDVVGGLIGLAVTAIFWFSLKGIGRLSSMFPNALLLIMAAISAAIIIKGFIQPERRDLFAEGDRPRVVVTACTLFSWLFAISWIGFYVASVAAFSFLAYYLARARRRVGILTFVGWVLIIAGEVGILYLIFTRFLYVPLPQGILF